MTDWKTIKHESYLADLAKARAEEREKVLSEVLEMVKHEAKMHHKHPMLLMVGKPDNNWNDGYDQALLAVLTKLNQLKGGE